MWRHFTELRERCIGCGARVHAGFGEVLPDDESHVAHLGCTIDESEPCPRCGTELTYPCEQDWADCCELCRRDFAAVDACGGTWDSTRAQFQWWCRACFINEVAVAISRYSRFIAMTFWWVWLVATFVMFFLILFWLGLRCTGELLLFPFLWLCKKVARS